MQQHPLTQEEFQAIYSKVPRLTVEVIVKNKDGAIYLTKRAIEPCKGQWHLPGGTVHFGESLIDAVKRVASWELGIQVKSAKNTGYIEYPSHFKENNGYPVGIVFEVTDFSGTFKLNHEAVEGGWFTHLPANTHFDQDTWLVDNHYLIR